LTVRPVHAEVGRDHPSKGAVLTPLGATTALVDLSSHHV
jgi:hypothetical protein